jgi:hypothetical protein
MEDVLDIYSQKPDPKRPLVCLDEFCKQLISEVIAPIPATPGRGKRRGTRRRFESEYVREGSASAFMIAVPHLGMRNVYIGEDARRTSIDYAKVLEVISDKMFPAAERIILVQDNLNTHQFGSLYKAFPPEKARRIASRFEFHYTPKHGSWLNMAEIEISVLSRSALKERIPNRESFERKITANINHRNAIPSPILWQFTTKDARIKLSRLYPAV